MADNQYKIELGIKLKDSDLRTEVARLGEKDSNKVKLGVELKTGEIRTQVSDYNKNTNNAKLHLKVKLDTDDLKTQIRELNLGGSGKGKGVSVPINTKSIKDAFKEVGQVIADIKNSLGTLDNKVNTKSLVAAVNQIANALEKATNESDGLVASLRALSNKDFNFNLGLNLGGSNPIGRNAAYGSKVRNETLPQLKQQATALENYFKEYYNVKDGFNAIWKLSSDSRFEKRQSDLFGLTTELNNSSGSLKSQMATYKEYIAIIKEAAQLRGIDISSVTSGFSKSADVLVKEAENIQTGANEMQDGFEKLKGIFNTGIDVEGLNGVLEPITKNLADIKKAFESLSSIGTIDGLTTSFKELTEVLEKLTSNITVVKQNLNNIGNVGTSTKQNTGVENIENDLKQVETAAEKTSNAIKETVSESKKLNFDISDGGIDELETSLRRLTDDDDIIEKITNEISEMGIVAKKVSGTLSGEELIKFDVQGIQKTEDGLERLITLTKTLTRTKDGELKWLDSSKQTQAINNDFEELKHRAKEISNLRIEIFKLDDVSKISRATAELDKLTDEYDELFAKTKGGLKNSQLSQLDNIVGSGDTKVIREFNSELKEFVKLQGQIENTRFEIGKLEIVGDKNNEIETLKRQLNELEDAYNRLMGTFMKKAYANGDIVAVDDFSNLKNGIAKATQDAENRLERFKSQYADTRAELARKIKVDIELGNFDDDVSRMQNKFDGLSHASNDLRASVETVNAALTELKNASKLNDDGVLDTERLIKAQEDYARAIEKTNNLIDIQARKDAADVKKQKLVDDRQVFQSKIDVWLTKNSAATKDFGVAMLDLKAKAENCDRVTLNHLESQFKKLDNAADKAGQKMLSLGDKIKTKFKEYMAYFSVAEVFMWVEQGFREMFNTVKEIDTAMTGLYRVTDLTTSQYDTLFDNMIGSAKEYGATLTDIINATTDWVRAGFDADTSLGLAEVTTMYQHISDLDYDTAAENLITAYNGFKDELNGAFSGDQVAAVNYIADIFNELDNNFAVTSAGLGEALTRSASALDLAGNSIQETAGMVTGIVEVTQDPEKAGKMYARTYSNVWCNYKIA